jgi:uncharacterized protein (TIGR00288 family)
LDAISEAAWIQRQWAIRQLLQGRRLKETTLLRIVNAIFTPYVCGSMDRIGGRVMASRMDTPGSEEPLIAVFVDFENVAIGARDMRAGKFQIQLILKRLLEKGRIVFKRAYCDWRHYEDSIREFHGQGIELIDIPQTKMSGKNSADIRMVVDALDLCYSKGHIDMFALISGDSDFSPLVSKLKENNKRVIGCGVKSSTSDLLIANCDEFIYYDDLIRSATKQQPKPPKTGLPKTETDKKQEARDRVEEVIRSLEQDYDFVWGSMLKQAVRRVYPQFNEDYYGYSCFSDLLEDLEDQGIIHLDFDERRGNYQVRRKQRKPTNAIKSEVKAKPVK